MNDVHMPNEGQCAAVVWHRDAYRYTGRKGGFELKYKQAQCKRKATHGKYCRQHAEMTKKGY